MNKNYLLIGSIIFVAVAGVAAASFFYANSKPAEPVACSMEAMQCPDGSYVARSGPKCEFAKCPVVNGTGVIKGKVDIGPICPVERIPPDPNCQPTPQMYMSHQVFLYSADGVTVVKSMHFLADGTYSFIVTPGTYILNIPTQGIGGSKDLPKTVTVTSGQTMEVNFSIDTGIR